jgi:glutamate-5-semialdehyde dehydrogenase
MSCERLTALTAGMPIPYGGDRVTRVPEALAHAFKPGDRLIVIQETGELLHAPAEALGIAKGAVDDAVTAFQAMGQVSDAQVTAFFQGFADRLADDAVWAPIAAANAEDVASAKARGRSTTRLVATEAMRAAMVAGLRDWAAASPSRGRLVERLDHPGWRVEALTAPLGVVGFVFEGRLNVFADAAGVLRGGNAVVFRIGSDALGAARVIVAKALEPALAAAGLPLGACRLADGADRALGWALFSDPRLALAVARGSGPAVAQLGAVARQAGTPVSLHGTGGAWIMADATADPEVFARAVVHSLDRKVCNTLNVCCIVRTRAADLTPRLLEALQAAGERRGHGWKLHVAEGDEALIPDDLRAAKARVRRAEGDREEALVEPIATADLGREWEWEETPEISLKIIEDVSEGVRLFNSLSPRFAASLISCDEAAHERFYNEIDAGFVGDGMTRWVDGQFALRRPELGLSNWEQGRLLARSGVLSGDSVYTVRLRMRQTDPDLHR